MLVSSQKKYFEFEPIRTIRPASRITVIHLKPKANPSRLEELKGDTGDARRFSLLLIQLITSLKYGKNGQRNLKEESYLGNR